MLIDISTYYTHFVRFQNWIGVNKVYFYKWNHKTICLTVKFLCRLIKQSLKELLVTIQLNVSQSLSSAIAVHCCR